MKSSAPALLLFFLALTACAPRENASSPGPAPAAGATVVAAPLPTPQGAAYFSPKAKPDVDALSALGRTMFFDPSLSVSGQQSCASCHSPDHAFNPPNHLSVQLGGPKLATQGTRAAPSLRYLQTSPPFSEHYHDDDGDDSIDAGPTGGLTWDGRADSTHDQARIPLLAKHEMGNPDAAAVLAKVERAPYAAQFRKLFGDPIFAQQDAAFAAVLMALEVFQDSPADFYPYTSKYDAYLRKQTELSPQEARGLALFNDADKGNCASCHISAVTPSGGFPQFTDHGLINIGVPRNRKLAANRDPAYFDMGLCGPDRTDLRDHPEYCGRFKTPTLRNVALRKAFFHNGIYHTLDEVMNFYVQRDIHPEKFYARNRDGSVHKYDDLPPGMDDNVNVEAPFDRHPGDQPALSAAEIRDVIAFLNTLTDGYAPDRTAASKSKRP